LKDRLGVLDGLRGIAVLLVLWYHVWELSWMPAPYPWMQFIPETGFVGVHLFFFLSGFVISYPFLRAVERGTTMPSWQHFYYRRFIKIAPSYLLSILVAFAIGYAAMVRYGSTPVWQELLTHLLFIHTWWQATYGSINGVLWTLAVEVEFYVLFPLVWFCFRRAPLITAAAMMLIALAWRMWTAHCCFASTFPILAENLPGYLDLFACGMLCAWAYVKFGDRVRESRWTWAMPVFALAGIVAVGELLFAIFGYRLAPNWEIAGMLRTRGIYGLCFAVIAFASLCSPRVWQMLLANPPLRFLAIISYNLYLYHQIVARELLNLHIPGYSGDPHADPQWQMQFTVVAIVATIAQAAVVTYLFERPVMNLRLPRPAAANEGHSPVV